MGAELETPPLERNRFGLSFEHTFQETHPQPFPSLESFFLQWRALQCNARRRTAEAKHGRAGYNTALWGRGRHQCAGAWRWEGTGRALGCFADRLQRGEGGRARPLLPTIPTAGPCSSPTGDTEGTFGAVGCSPVQQLRAPSPASSALPTHGWGTTRWDVPVFPALPDKGQGLSCWKILA